MRKKNNRRDSVDIVCAVYYEIFPMTYYQYDVSLLLKHVFLQHKNTLLNKDTTQMCENRNSLMLHFHSEHLHSGPSVFPLSIIFQVVLEACCAIFK